MVKVPNRSPTPIEPRPVAGIGGQLPSDVCPPLEVEVAFPSDLAIRVGDPVPVQVRAEQVRLMWHAQVIGFVEDGAKARTIIQCHEGGRPYGGRVTTIEPDRAVILLESRD